MITRRHFSFRYSYNDPVVVLGICNSKSEIKFQTFVSLVYALHLLSFEDKIVLNTRSLSIYDV